MGEYRTEATMDGGPSGREEGARIGAEHRAAFLAEFGEAPDPAAWDTDLWFGTGLLDCWREAKANLHIDSYHQAAFDVLVAAYKAALFGRGTKR